jgi:hypothetical protein
MTVPFRQACQMGSARSWPKQVWGKLVCNMTNFHRTAGGGSLLTAPWSRLQDGPRHSTLCSFNLVLASSREDLQEPRGSGDPAAEESRAAEQQGRGARCNTTQGLRLDEREKSAVATMARNEASAGGRGEESQTGRARGQGEGMTYHSKAAAGTV